jgi:glycosyltransferase involved in cell wall biosynthesis
MKILSLSTVPLLPHLGSGKTRLNWTNGLRSLGHNVDVLQPKDFELWPSLKIAKKYRFALGVFFKAKRLIAQNNYDLIEFYGDDYWVLLLWLKKIKIIDSVVVAHVDGIELYDVEKEEQFWSTRSQTQRWIDIKTHRKFTAITFELADKFVCGCDDELQYVLKNNLFTPRDAACVSPGIDDSYHDIPFIDEKKKNIIFFGSWIDRKGIKNVPAVISIILEKYEDYFFEVYGSWSAKEEILHQFKKGLHNQIIIHDKLPADELINQLCAARIFFFPTYSEGFGLATLEAMSCSIATVTTPTGIGANLRNDVNAKICNFDDKKAMIEAVCQLIDDNKLRETIAYNGYLFAKDFVWNKQVKLLEKMYSNWLV